MEINYYGSLCTEMYETLHHETPTDELAFYLSYARRNEKILEPLCGSGRFLVPFLRQGFDISGFDLSAEMLAKLKLKEPSACVERADVLGYRPGEPFDYVFVTSGSISLFTDAKLCRNVLCKLKSLVKQGGKLVFAVDTIANRCPDDIDWNVVATSTTEEGDRLVLKSKNRFDEQTQTQFSPGLYQLYRGDALLHSELMDFQTHLYRFGEMEQILTDCGFGAVKTYASFDKAPATCDADEMFLFECSL